MTVGLLGRLFTTGPQRDGASEALEALATGITPASLSIGVEAGSMPPGPMPPGSAPSAARSRRERALDDSDPMAVALAQKIMHGWLQNRHQTLFPLTVNLRTLSATQVATLAGMIAVAASCCGAASAERASSIQAWFGQAGADDAGLADLQRALAAPPPLGAVIDAALAESLGAYAYVAALIAIDRHDPATGFFLDFLAARLALPVTVIRSANRRYRR